MSLLDRMLLSDRVVMALPYLLALVSVAGIVLTGVAGVRLMQHKMGRATVLLGIIGFVFIIAAVVAWRSVFRYWDAGAG